MISVRAAASVDADLVAAVTTLLPQLSRSAVPPTPEMLEWIVEDDPRTTLFVAYDGERVVGMLTLVVFPIPTAIRAWIEDVVVDEASRGSGAGAALVEAALVRAGEVGARTVDLTSRPDREAANRLYLRLGFEQRATNVYRHTLGGAGA